MAGLMFGGVQEQALALFPADSFAFNALLLKIKTHRFFNILNHSSFITTCVHLVFVKSFLSRMLCQYIPN